MNSTFSFSERRIHERLKKALSVIMLTEPYNNPFENTDYTDTVNISLTGMCVPVNKNLTTLDSKIRISIFVPPKNNNEEFKLLNIKGNIVRVEKAKGPLSNTKDYLAGLEFFDVKKEDTQVLESYIKAISAPK